MKIHVALLPTHLPSDWKQYDTVAIVIDTLRFTTTACQALSMGAHSVHIAGEISELVEMAARCPGKRLLCGERHCQRIEGFDLGNSPYEYTRERVENANLFFTTTNGTRAVAAVQAATRIWLGSMINRRAVCQALEGLDPMTVWIVCSGTDGEITLEDVLTAGAILERFPDSVAGDEAWLAYAAWSGVISSRSAEDCLKAVRGKFGISRGGRNLVESGFSRDVDFASQLDIVNLVPKNTTDWNCFGP